MTVTSMLLLNMVSLVMMVWFGAAAALELADFGQVEAFHGMDTLI